ncbi:hypothetical protein Prum_067970 [Phytohabitans rumicis]|uniref:Uncharacterized protein n=1 Tax=Phytohabitans rumicis TaxID=1076125 RepID=A0A6V8LKJ1_9ACTN|nr:hypothetical protein Prum_067970 [Phytohabitans rumicis]
MEPVRAGRNPPRKTVWHCSIRNHPTDRTLTDAQWAHIGAEVMAAVGLAAHGDLDAVPTARRDTEAGDGGSCCPADRAGPALGGPARPAPVNPRLAGAGRRHEGAPGAPAQVRQMVR